MNDHLRKRYSYSNGAIYCLFCSWLSVVIGGPVGLAVASLGIYLFYKGEFAS